jgi:hypothetical protein
MNKRMPSVAAEVTRLKSSGSPGGSEKVRASLPGCYDFDNRHDLDQ